MSGDGEEQWEAEQARIAEEKLKADPEYIRQKAEFERLMGEGVLRMGLPDGKSLWEKTEALLASAHIHLEFPHPRSVRADVSGFPWISDAIRFKPNQIAARVDDGTVAFGITGDDVRREHNECDARRDVLFSRIKVCTELSYSCRTSGKTVGVLFTAHDNPVSNISKIPENESVATEYPMATIRLLFQHGIKADIIECTGNAEALVVSGRCRYGVTLIETGDTLRANGLKVIGTVFESSTVLIANKAALADPRIEECLSFLSRKLVGVLNARGKVYLLMNAPAAKVAEVSKFLKRQRETLQEPTVSPLFNGSMFYAIGSIVRADRVNHLEMKLAQLGADGFVELDPSAIL